MRSIYLILLAGILLTNSCVEKKLKEHTLNGIWESVGSGWILQIQDSSQYSLFDITSISCLPNRQSDLDEIVSSLTLKEDTLCLLKGIITYKFTKVKQLPELCQYPMEATKQQDPLFNFEVFAETVKEHYAFFELNGIDWEALYQEQKGKLNTHSNEAELYLVIEETLEKLNDNHAFLEAKDEVYEILDEIEDEDDALSPQEELPEIGDFQIAQMLAEHHLEEEMTQDSWLIQWGKMTDKIGYIQIKAMWLYAKLDIPEALIEELGYVDAYVQTFHQMYEGDYIEKEAQAAAKIMGKLMEDLENSEAIVLDVRFNGGGQDAVSQEILSYFIPERLQIAKQRLRYGNGFSPTLAIYNEGKSDAYTKPVYILTSPQTGSAAEAFAITTMAMKNAKRIGSRTSGALSTALEKTLPNGWAFSISNEINYDNEGNSYENIGVPVDYELNYSRDRQEFFRSVADDLAGDKEAILKAIGELEQK